MLSFTALVILSSDYSHVHHKAFAAFRICDTHYNHDNPAAGAFHMPP